MEVIMKTPIRIGLWAALTVMALPTLAIAAGPGNPGPSSPPPSPPPSPPHLLRLQLMAYRDPSSALGFRSLRSAMACIGW